MDISHLYRLCQFIVLFVYLYHVVDTADFAVFIKDPTLDSLKCVAEYEEFSILTPWLGGCVSRCLKHAKCLAVFYDQSQMWCQGCTSTDNTISATGIVGFSAISSLTIRYETCSDHLASGKTTSGVYSIQPSKTSDSVIRVYCDMDTLGGGWTVFQRRFNGQLDFHRIKWGYDQGFGDPSGEHWLGLKYVSRAMTKKVSQEVYLEFIDADDNVAFEHYTGFYVATKQRALTLGQLINATDGNIANAGFGLNNGMSFSAITGECGAILRGGWWYNSVDNCTKINPNGDYATPGTLSPYSGGDAGMVYKPFGHRKSMKETKLMFRKSTP